MNNLLTATSIGTIFVDHQLRILCFTTAATRIINLIQSDVGRPVAHIVSNLVGYDCLVEDVQEVLNTLILKVLDVQTTEGKWYTMYITPNCTLDNVVEGAVITFVNITEMMRTEAVLRESELRFRTLIEQAPVATITSKRWKHFGFIRKGRNQSKRGNVIEPFYISNDEY